MLVSRRRVGDWIRIRHQASGDVLDIRICEIGPGRDLLEGDVNFAFDDAARRFQIGRHGLPERRRAPVAAGGAGDRS